MTATGEGKTTNDKKFGNNPRKRIETVTEQRKITNNKKFGNHPRKGIKTTAKSNQNKLCSIAQLDKFRIFCSF